MRVGFEVSELYPHNAGTHTYGTQLLRHLVGLSNPPDLTLLDGLGRRSLHEVLTANDLNLGHVRFFNAPNLPTFSCRQCGKLARLRSLRIVECLDRYTLAKLWQEATSRPVTSEMLVPRSFLQSVDVCHWSGAIFRPLVSVPTVVTLHDVLPALHPEWFVDDHRNHFVHQLAVVGKHATRIITDSTSTKLDVMRVLGVDSSRIDVIPLAASPDFRPAERTRSYDDILGSYGLSAGKYILCVSTIEPRKNLVRLAQAFRLATQATSCSDIKLVLAGKRGWLTEDTDAGLKNLGLGERLVMPGRVPSQELAALLGNATAVTYLSLYEGFGLPPLEAMACGAPVLASNTSSLPEVIGDAGLLVDPCNVQGVADALSRLLTDPLLRTVLKERGLLRAKQFTWEKTASLTMQSYQRAVEDHQRAARGRAA
jgi:glycosyltransferase involved in cell wall biosynthesis